MCKIICKLFWPLTGSTEHEFGILRMLYFLSLAEMIIICKKRSNKFNLYIRNLNRVVLKSTTANDRSFSIKPAIKPGHPGYQIFRNNGAGPVHVPDRVKGIFCVSPHLFKSGRIFINWITRVGLRGGGRKLNQSLDINYKIVLCLSTPSFFSVRLRSNSRWS